MKVTQRMAVCRVVLGGEEVELPSELLEDVSDWAVGVK